MKRFMDSWLFFPAMAAAGTLVGFSIVLFLVVPKRENKAKSNTNYVTTVMSPESWTVGNMIVTNEVSTLVGLVAIKNRATNYLDSGFLRVVDREGRAFFFRPQDVINISPIFEGGTNDCRIWVKDLMPILMDCDCDKAAKLVEVE